MTKSVTKAFDPTKMTVKVTNDEFEKIAATRKARPKSEFRVWLESLKIGEVTKIEDAENATKYRSAIIQVARNAKLGVQTKIDPDDGCLVIKRVLGEDEQAETAPESKGRSRRTG